MHRVALVWLVSVFAAAAETVAEQARFSPDANGVWRYRWEWAADAGLDGGGGEFECRPYEGSLHRQRAALALSGR